MDRWRLETVVWTVRLRSKIRSEWLKSLDILLTDECWKQYKEKIKIKNCVDLINSRLARGKGELNWEEIECGRCVYNEIQRIEDWAKKS